MCGFVLVINGNPFFWGNSYFAPGFPAAIPAGALPALLAGGASDLREGVLSLLFRCLCRNLCSGPGNDAGQLVPGDDHDPPISVIAGLLVFKINNARVCVQQ